MKTAMMENKFLRRRMISGIYKIINTKNGHAYIGSAVNLKQREQKHFSSLEKNKHCNKYLQNDFVKYGQGSFIFDVVEYCKKETLIEREQFFLDAYRPQREFLYNIRLVVESNLGLKYSDNTKKKISLAGKAYYTSGGINPLQGKKHSEETKQKMSLALKGKKLSEETKQKMPLAGGTPATNGRQATNSWGDEASKWGSSPSPIRKRD